MAKRESFHLTPTEVQLIRESTLSHAKLAEVLGVTRHAVMRLRLGRTYRDGANEKRQQRPSALVFDENGDLTPESFDVELKSPWLGRTLRERIENRLVPKPNGCVGWKGSINGYGRPRVSLEGGRLIAAARLIWIMNKGPIPKGLVVRHGPCNDDQCVNIDHFELGTRGDNSRDRERDGTVPHGTRAWNVKMNEALVRAARQPAADLRALSEASGIGYHTLYQARIGISWKHITDPPPVPPRSSREVH